MIGVPNEFARDWIEKRLASQVAEALGEVLGDSVDVRVVVDRRVGERRRPRWVSGSGPLSERRHGERRGADVSWSLPDMPFSAS